MFQWKRKKTVKLLNTSKQQRKSYKYAEQITINANYTAFDNKAGFVYSTGSVMNKNDDYSMSYWNGEISNRNCPW